MAGSLGLAVGAALGLLIGLVVGGRRASRREQREAQARIEADQRARQAQHLAELGSMTGGLAHEIKNPLSTLGLNAQLIAEAVDELPEDQPVKPRLRARSGALRRESERLRGILQDFLDYAGAVRLERTGVDVGATLTEMVDFLSPEAQRAGVRLRLEPPEAGLSVRADVRLLKQALLNLLLNAVQAVGGPVVTGASGAGGAADVLANIKGEVILRAKAAQGGVSIDVIDTGPGISDENLDKVFRPYFTTKAGGTGLGLPTSRRYVEEHGGTLTVRSTPGLGTQFTIWLPA
jgi:signal transduction histidine kinase